MSFVDLGAALWLGILTSISPCPLTTNIAAISFVGRRVAKTRFVLLSGLLYALGRCTAYILVGFLVVKGLMAVPGLSNFLQRYMNRLLGPILIIVGLALLNIFKFSFPGGGIGYRLQHRAESMGIFGAGLLGFFFALAFCPTSAGLFFGGLVPLAIKSSGFITMPGLYGMGTALPVIVFAVVIAYSAHAIGKVFNVMTKIDKWSRMITAVLLILIGIHSILNNWLGVYLGI